MTAAVGVDAWQWRYRWSIAIYRGASPLDLQPAHPRGRPVLTPRHVTDIRAAAVADPFVVVHDGDYLMFLEALNADNGRGEIAYATSGDGLSWSYQSVVLREQFHLSYPQVFRWDGSLWMLPETRAAGEIRLYRAEAFPGGWRQEAVLLIGPFADATVHLQDGRWWLFAQRGLDELNLFSADTPLGPWEPHPRSPLWEGNRTRTRPGGRLVECDGRLIRLAQDGWPSYGYCLRAYEIDRLDGVDYAEHEVPESPILTASKAGWNAMAMHHLEVIRRDGDGWLVAVDGATFGPVAPR